MNCLLNTHTLIWAVTEPQKLSNRVKAILEDDDNEIFVSAISFWEIALKHSLHKLNLEALTPTDFLTAAIETGFRLLNLDSQTAITYHTLAATHHRDPFDRMLIWQALKNNYWLISKDESIHKYADISLNVLW